MGVLSPSSWGKAASSSKGIPGSGQPHKAVAEGSRQSLERNRNWLRARGKSQQILVLQISQLAGFLTATISEKSRTAGADQPLNTKVRTLGVPWVSAV